MKLRQKINWKHKPKFLKIKLLKSQTYKNIYNSQLLKVENIEYRIKKILHIIYQFHINNKTILFVGIPTNLINEVAKLFAGTKHIFIPQNIWINGAITNQQTIFRYLLKLKSTNSTNAGLLFQLKQKSDLIVVLNEKNNESVLKEGYLSKKPIICLNSSSLNTMNDKVTFRVPGNFNFTNKKLNNSFLYLIFKAISRKQYRN